MVTKFFRVDEASADIIPTTTALASTDKMPDALMGPPVNPNPEPTSDTVPPPAAGSQLGAALEPFVVNIFPLTPG
jgi:hypothetical protein